MSRARPGRPAVCVITGYGINADEELAVAFERAGARARRVHVRDLMDEPALLSSFAILAFPGGFSFGDHLGSGKVFATLFRRSLGSALPAFVRGGGLVIGICNGFQVLVKAGLLPDRAGQGAQEVSLVHNLSGRFEDRWVRVRFEQDSRCVWTRGLGEMDAPVRHGEGRFVAGSARALAALGGEGLVAARYVTAGGGEPAYPEDPNGSDGHIAGICDPTGRVFGLMPHPEAFLHPENHPTWTSGGTRSGDGLRLFVNGVRAAAAMRAGSALP
jgi:phosphoribosylformylglycinamidine synthase subunit PurQ / glutaminase